MEHQTGCFRPSHTGPLASVALHAMLSTVALFAAIWEAGEAVGIALQCLFIQRALGNFSFENHQRCGLSGRNSRGPVGEKEKKKSSSEAQTSWRVLPRVVRNIFLVECRLERQRVEGVVQLVVGWSARGGFLARGPLAPPPPPLPLPPGEGS